MNQGATVKRFNIATLLGAGAVALALSPIVAATAQAADGFDEQGYQDCITEHAGEGWQAYDICCITHGGKPGVLGYSCKDPAKDRAVAPSGQTSSKNPTVPRAVDPTRSGLF